MRNLTTGETNKHGRLMDWIGALAIVLFLLIIAALTFFSTYLSFRIFAIND